MPLRENAHTAKKVLRIFLFFSGKGIFTYYQFSHLTTIFFMRKNSYFSDIRFLQCADFAKSPGKMFSMVLKTDMHGGSSGADIRPSLYNQALSTILQASQIFQNFLFLRISHFRFSVCQVLPAKYWPEPKKYEIRNFQKEKNPGILGGLQNCRQGLVIQIWLNI